MYRCEAVSIAGFVQQLAVAYVRNGYWFYVTGKIPKGKEPTKTDQKLIEKYDIGRPRTTVARRKRAGESNVQYLRYRQTFVLIATPGKHRFFECETNFRDIRRKPLKLFGYSIGYRRGNDGKYHASVRIEEREWKWRKAKLIDHCCQRTTEELQEKFKRIPFEPYAPVRSQLLNVLRAVNAKRKTAGLEPVPLSCLRLQRRPLRPFSDGMYSSE